MKINRNTKRLIAPVLKTVVQDDEFDCPILWKDLLKLKAFFRISTGFKIHMKYYFQWRSSIAIYLVTAKSYIFQTNITYSLLELNIKLKNKF